MSSYHINTFSSTKKTMGKKPTVSSFSFMFLTVQCGQKRTECTMYKIQSDRRAFVVHPFDRSGREDRLNMKEVNES